MRFHRIKVTNWRGVEEREVQLEDAINVIVGRNEAGKTSLFEAVRHLFQFKAKSKHHDIKSTQSAGSEAGPEVELEFSFGEWRVIYRKRWITRPETVLRVLEPVPEQMSGDEAHERMEELLENHCDLGLWLALSVQQGAGMTQAQTGSTSLGAALEGRRTTDGAADDAPALCERVEAAFLEFWTRTGQVGVACKELQAEHESCQREEEGLEARILELETTIERLEDRRKSLAAEHARAPKLREDFEREEAAERAVRELEGRVELQQERVEAAQLVKDQALGQVRAREDLRQQIDASSKMVTKAEKAAERLEGEVRDLDLQIRERKVEEETGRKRVEALQKETDRAKIELEVLEGKFQQGKARLHLETFRKDKQTWAEAESEAAAADVSDECLAAIRAARESLRNATARLQGAGGELRIEAHAELKLTLDDQDLELQAGETVEQRFGAEAVLSIPELVDIRVGAGASVTKLKAAETSANDKYLALCRESGVESISEAEQRRTRADLIRGRGEDARKRLELEVERHLGAAAE
ncbi:MAG: AAA family ATPase, partial [Planctomycetota bacterium]